MSTLTNNLLANHQYDLSYGAMSPHVQQTHRLLSLQGPTRPSFYAVTPGLLDGTILNPRQQAGYIYSRDDEDTHNSTTVAQQIIGAYGDGD